ncbi:Uu.00g062270.m01.CDS01 [Anthostomella pinea]|uniref:Uu.00g062270.m01.CDS01 n=1 Tax=Anthostomella pinea TaxID=933095 RepID=A0AAI8VT36_9PEZI|nr:Uu.00g062270.m01.CDS01 [Anthostomella pinea]
MLRSARPLLASSSRAIATATTKRRPISSLRHVSVRPAIITSSSSATAAIIQTSKYATKSPTGMQQGIDPEQDKKVAARKLQVNPENVSTESSVRHFYEPDTQPTAKPVHEGVKADLETVKETFSLDSVPKEPYWLGLAGTLPYLGTSVSTLYLSWCLNTEWPSSSALANGILISHDTARQLLGHLEPIQLGYGAVLISFIGATHWGLEYAEKTASHDRTRFRYGLGVLASVVAWPTLLMPMEFALTSQFAAFVALYFADARATVRGWAPSWYGVYRFVLTAIVGGAIAISLIGRTKVGDAQPRLTGLGEKFHEHRGEEQYDEKWEKAEEKEREKVAKQKKAEEKKKKEEEKAAKEKERKEKKEGKGEKKDEKNEGREE